MGHGLPYLARTVGRQHSGILRQKQHRDVDGDDDRPRPEQHPKIAPARWGDRCRAVFPTAGRTLGQKCDDLAEYDIAATQKPGCLQAAQQMPDGVQRTDRGEEFIVRRRHRDRQQHGTRHGGRPRAAREHLPQRLLFPVRDQTHRRKQPHQQICRILCPRVGQDRTPDKDQASLDDGDHPFSHSFSPKNHIVVLPYYSVRLAVCQPAIERSVAARRKKPRHGDPLPGRRFSRFSCGSPLSGVAPSTGCACADGSLSA